MQLRGSSYHEYPYHEYCKVHDGILFSKRAP